jgi:hypothetical protein
MTKLVEPDRFGIKGIGSNGLSSDIPGVVPVIQHHVKLVCLKTISSHSKDAALSDVDPADIVIAIELLEPFALQYQGRALSCIISVSVFEGRGRDIGPSRHSGQHDILRPA